LLHGVCVIGQFQQLILRQRCLFCDRYQLHVQLSVDGAQGFVIRRMARGVGGEFEGFYA
jgi:hypothetical protein